MRQPNPLPVDQPDSAAPVPDARTSGGDRQTAANRTAALIAGRVLDGAYRPGESLREIPLAEDLGVSRSTIREALRILERDGVVRIEPHRGASVTQLSPEELIEIYQVRTVLLGLAMGLCAQRCTDREVQALKRLHQRMVRAVDDPRPAAAAGCLQHCENPGFLQRFLPALTELGDGSILCRCPNSSQP